MSALVDIKRDHLERLTTKRAALVSAMVWDGLRMKEAAEAVGFSQDRARKALRDPDVRKALADEMQVMRSSAKPRAIRNLAEIGDQKGNLTAAVMANKAILADEEGAKTAMVNINITPGYAVDLSDRPRVKVIDHQADDVIRVDDGEADMGMEDA